LDESPDPDDVGPEKRDTLPMSLKDATPYWMARHEAVSNDFATDGMALLTAANMSGKSTLLRTVTAAALLANCGLCVPASSAVVPAFDVIFLRNTAYDAPKEGKSSFGVEMSDIRDLLAVVTPRSLVMVDELGKGTSSSEGAALSGAILEHFSSIGCYGVFASHLFELFELPMEAANLELLTMEVVVEDIVDSEATTSDGSDGNGLAGPEGGLLLGSPSDGGSSALRLFDG
jgi:DNA mismatch repair ATPase MutS